MSDSPDLLFNLRQSQLQSRKYCSNLTHRPENTLTNQFIFFFMCIVGSSEPAFNRLRNEEEIFCSPFMKDSLWDDRSFPPSSSLPPQKIKK